MVTLTCTQCAALLDLPFDPASWVRRTIVCSTACGRLWVLSQELMGRDVVRVSDDTIWVAWTGDKPTDSIYLGHLDGHRPKAVRSTKAASTKA